MLDTAQSFPWPRGFRAAAAFTFDVDGESAILSSAPEASARLTVMTHQEYGPRVGVARLLRILSQYNIKSTFFVPGYTADRHPDAIRAIFDDGHEIAHHGYLHESLIGVSEQEERAILQRGIDALERITKERPTGYRAPSWETNYRTPRLLREFEFRYDSSLMDDDVPYRLATGNGESLIEIPVHWALDDWEQYAYLPDLTGTGYMASPSDMLERWTLDLEATRAEGLLFVLVNHPFLSGRPSRAAALARLLERAVELGDIWIDRLDRIAVHAESLCLPQRTHQQPEGFIPPSG